MNSPVKSIAHNEQKVSFEFVSFFKHYVTNSTSSIHFHCNLNLFKDGKSQNYVCLFKITRNLQIIPFSHMVVMVETGILRKWKATIEKKVIYSKPYDTKLRYFHLILPCILCRMKRGRQFTSLFPS